MKEEYRRNTLPTEILLGEYSCGVAYRKIQKKYSFVPRSFRANVPGGSPVAAAAARATLFQRAASIWPCRSASFAER